MSVSDDMHTEFRQRLIAGHYDPGAKLREEHVASESGKDCRRVGRSEVSTPSVGKNSALCVEPVFGIIKSALGFTQFHF